MTEPEEQQTERFQSAPLFGVVFWTIKWLAALLILGGLIGMLVWRDAVYFEFVITMVAVHTGSKWLSDKLLIEEESEYA